MIAACQHDKLPKEVRFADFDLNAYKLDAQGPLYLGWDFARHKHLSVMWLDEEVGDVAWARLIIVMQDVAFSRQEELAAGLLRKLPITRMCIDATGIGENSSEKLKTDFGAYRVEPVKFTNQVKADLAVRMRQAFEDRRCRIPLCKLLRDDLHAVRKTTTSAGNVRFDADATDKGHADRFWAGALAKMASNRGAIKPEIIWL
jgi:phage FluMu gp28-like protein